MAPDPAPLQPPQNWRKTLRTLAASEPVQPPGKFERRMVRGLLAVVLFCLGGMLTTVGGMAMALMMKISPETTGGTAPAILGGLATMVLAGLAAAHIAKTRHRFLSPRLVFYSLTAPLLLVLGVSLLR